jgi:hypothetical protein
MTNAAINVDSVLIWGLKAATGVEVYPNGVEEGAGSSYITYKRISDRLQDRSQATGGGLHLGRFQITHVAASFDALRTLVTNVQGYLENNQTDFSVSLADDLHIENKEAEDIYTAVKDYFIQWKSI